MTRDSGLFSNWLFSLQRNILIYRNDLNYDIKRKISMKENIYCIPLLNVIIFCKLAKLLIFLSETCYDVKMKMILSNTARGKLPKKPNALIIHLKMVKYMC